MPSECAVPPCEAGGSWGKLRCRKLWPRPRTCMPACSRPLADDSSHQPPALCQLSASSPSLPHKRPAVQARRHRRSRRTCIWCVGTSPSDDVAHRDQHGRGLQGCPRCHPTPHWSVLTTPSRSLHQSCFRLRAGPRQYLDLLLVSSELSVPPLHTQPQHKTRLTTHHGRRPELR